MKKDCNKIRGCISSPPSLRQILLAVRIKRWRFRVYGDKHFDDYLRSVKWWSHISR